MTPFKNRIHDETEQLLLDIRRIAPSGEPYVLFGDLFDDDDVQQYYESLIGTLKSAKKRKCRFTWSFTWPNTSRPC